MGAGYQALGDRTAYEVEMEENLQVQNLTDDYEVTKKRLELRLEKMLGGRPDEDDLNARWWSAWSEEADDVLKSMQTAAEEDGTRIENYLLPPDASPEEREDLANLQARVPDLVESIINLSATKEQFIDQLIEDFRKLVQAAEEAWDAIERINNEDDAQEAIEKLQRLEDSDVWQNLMRQAQQDEADELHDWQSASRDTIDLTHEFYSALRAISNDLECSLEEGGHPGPLDEIQRGPVHPNPEQQRELENRLAD